MKKIALMLPPVKRMHIDLENRRRRVKELEGHIPILKKQMARAINSGKSAGLSSSAVSSDVKYLRDERDKFLKLNKNLTKKYDNLYREYCVLSMSNEALIKTNDALVNGDFHKLNKPKATTAKTVKKTTRRRSSKSNGSSTSTQKKTTRAKTSQK